MTIKERLLQEYEAAINAVYGDLADKQEEEVNIKSGDIDSIGNKVKFYLDI